MALNPELLTYLICPDCKSDRLLYSETEQTITCQDCKAVYPVIDEIPVMITQKRETPHVE